MLATANPFDYFADLSGDALDDGYVYYGQPNQDPIQFPKAVYFDEALTIPAPQPLRTIAGFISRNGAPAYVFTDGNYSILVQDKHKRQIYFVADFDLIGSQVAATRTDISKVVDNIAALRSLDSAKFKNAFVNGYYAPADGGGGSYWYDSSDTTSADNGGTIIVANNGARWKLVYTDYVSVKQFGAKGDNLTNNDLTLQAALTAMQGNKARLRIPAGKYLKTALLNVTAPIWIEGDGMTESIIRDTSGTSGGIQFNYPSFIQGGGISNLTLEAGAGWLSSGFQGTGSTGVGLKMVNVNGLFDSSNVGINNFAGGLLINSCWTNKINNTNVLFFQNYGIMIDQTAGSGGSGGDNHFTSCFMVNNGFTGNNTGSVGVFVVASGSEIFTKVNVAKAHIGLGLYPPNGKQINYCFFDSCLFDSNDANGIEVTGDFGSTVSVEFVNCWSAFNGSSGMLCSGPNLRSVRWTGGRIRENAANGVIISTNGGVYLNGLEIASNSRGNPNTYAGVVSQATMGNWALMNSRVGNFASGFTDQGYGVVLNAGAAANVRIIGNDLTGFGAGTGGINNLATLSNSLVTPNI